MPDKRLVRRLVRATRHLVEVLDEVVSSQSPKRCRNSKPAAGSAGPPIEQAILGALADGSVLNAKQIARKAGYRYSSRLRGGLADAARRGLIVRTPDGYRKSDN